MNTIDVSFKQRFVEHCIQLQEETLSSVENQIHLAEEAANNYGPNKDRYDGFRNQQVRQGNMLAKQMDLIQQNLDTLHLVNLQMIHPDANFGALIVTDRNLIFVCCSLGLVSFENQRVVVISKTAPIFPCMESKKTGDSFICNGLSQKIQQII